MKVEFVNYADLNTLIIKQKNLNSQICSRYPQMMVIV